MIFMSYNGHGQVHCFQEMALIISLEEQQNERCPKAWCPGEGSDTLVAVL